MKIYRCVVVTFLFIIMLPILYTNVSALNTGFEIEKISEMERNDIIENIDIKPLLKEPTKSAIECFDISDDGKIALGHSDLGFKTVTVYSENGTYLYGFQFNNYGSFGIEWDQGNIIIYFVRSDILISVSNKGEIEEIFDVPNTSNNDFYRRNVINSPERFIGEKQYFLNNDMGILNLFASNYSQLICKTLDKEIILYNANQVQSIKMVIILSFVLICIVLVVWSITTKLFLDNTHNTGDHNTGDGSLC